VGSGGASGSVPDAYVDAEIGQRRERRTRVAGQALPQDRHARAGGLPLPHGHLPVRHLTDRRHETTEPTVVAREPAAPTAPRSADVAADRRAFANAVHQIAADTAYPNPKPIT